MKWKLTAEHCNGKSVAHPCKNGVYDDPANTFETEVRASDEAEAEREGLRLLKKIVETYPPCNCTLGKCPGSNDWWNSVAIHARRAEPARRSGLEKITDEFKKAVNEAVKEAVNEVVDEVVIDVFRELKKYAKRQ